MTYIFFIISIIILLVYLIVGAIVSVQNPLAQHPEHRGPHREQGADGLVILIIAPAVSTQLETWSLTQHFVPGDALRQARPGRYNNNEHDTDTEFPLTAVCASAGFFVGCFRERVGTFFQSCHNDRDSL